MKFSIRKTAFDLQSEGNNIINIFSKTVEKLQKLNSKIDTELTKDLEEKEELTKTLKSVELDMMQKEDLKLSNSKIINKINTFLNY